MVDSEFEQIWKQIEHDREHGHMDPEDQGKSEEQLTEEYRRIAERRVRLGLLLSEIGRNQNIDVTQEELNQALIQEVQRYPGQEREVFEYYQNNQEALQNLRAPVYEDKVINYILELANTKERQLDTEQLRAEMQAEQGVADDDGGEEAESGKSSGGKKKSAGAKSGGSKSGGSKSGSKSTGSKASGGKSAASKDDSEGAGAGKSASKSGGSKSGTSKSAKSS